MNESRFLAAKSPALAWRVLWFVVGAMVTYVFVMVVALNKQSVLRGARVGETYADVRENDARLDFGIVGAVAVVVGLLTLFRGRIGLSREFIIGQWLALLAWVIIILAHPANARLVLEKVDMLSSLGVMQQAPEEEVACPPVYCITPSASPDIGTFARSFARVA